MTEPTITCPNCHTVIPLTESLAAPLVAATRKQFEEQLARKNEEIAKCEQGGREKETLLADAKLKLDEQIANQVSAQLQLERTRIIAEEARKSTFAGKLGIKPVFKELRFHVKLAICDIHRLCAIN